MYKIINDDSRKENPKKKKKSFHELKFLPSLKGGLGYYCGLNKLHCINIGVNLLGNGKKFGWYDSNLDSSLNQCNCKSLLVAA